MEPNATDEELNRSVWLVGHSYPREWIDRLNGPLDPRHPTRHSIWTSVLDYLQEQVYVTGPHLRLDMARCFLCNAAGQQPPKSKRSWVGKDPYILARIELLRTLLKRHNPPVVITFSAEVFVFLSRTLCRFPGGVSWLPRVEELGRAFREAISCFDPKRVNVFPLLHAYAARRGWDTVGPKFSGPDDQATNYFEYAGRALGDMLLKHGRSLPIWHSRPCDDTSVFPHSIERSSKPARRSANSETRPDPLAPGPETTRTPS
jgi:hypothetical protein